MRLKPRRLSQIEDLRREIDTQTEQYHHRLAAISAAALSNTRETHMQVRLDRDNPMWSIAYVDTFNAVEREMALREQLQTMTDWAQALADAIGDVQCWKGTRVGDILDAQPTIR